MLPDFPDLKRIVIQDAHSTMERLLYEQHPILADIKTCIQHEGCSMRYEQVGYGEKEEHTQEYSFAVEIRPDEVPSLIGDNLTAKMQQLADVVAERQMKMLLSKHDEATQMTGKRFDAASKPLDGAMLLEVTNMIPADFDTQGNILPTTKLLTHPDMMPMYKTAIEEIANDPELQSRHRANTAKKYNEWVDRENSRKLVD